MDANTSGPLTWHKSARNLCHINRDVEQSVAQMNSVAVSILV